MSHRVTAWYPRCYSCPSLSQFLLSLMVCTLFHICCITCGLHSRLCTSDLQTFYENKAKSYQKNQLAGALPRLRVDVGLPVREHLCTLGACLCLEASLDAVPQKRKTGTMGGRWQDLAVTSSAGLIAHRILFLKLVAVKEIPMLVIVIAGLSR